MRPFLRSLLLALLLAAPAGAAPIPPGHEQEVLRLVQGPLDGATVESIRIGAEVIELDLTTPGGPVTLTLGARDGRGDGERIGETASFELRRRAGPASEAERVMLARIAERDDGTFFATLEEAAAPQPAVEARDPGAFDEVLRAALWAALLLALLVLVRPTRSGFVGALVVLALAVGARWVQPRAPLHANDHGITELRGLSGAPVPWTATDESDRYGPAYRQVVHVLSAPLGGGSSAVFGLGIVFGALGCVAAFLLARLLFGSLEAGLLAGAVLALHPAHARLSSSESPFTLAATLLLVALCGAVVAGDREGTRVRRLAGAVLFGAGLALGSELAVTTLVLPVVGVVAVAGLSMRGELRRTLGLVALPLFVVAGVAAVHLWSLTPLLAEARAERGAELLPEWGKLVGANLLFDRDATSWLLLPAAVAGLVVLALRGRARTAIALGGGAFLLLVSGSSVIAARTDLLRYQTPSHVLLAVACGALVGSSMTRLARTALVALVAVAFAVTSFGGLRAPRSLDEQSFLLVRRAARELPAAVRIVLPPARMGKVRADFPEFVLAEQGIRVETHEVSKRPRQCLVWVPPACYAFTAEELAEAGGRLARFEGQPLRRECAELVAAADPTQRAFVVEADVPWRAGEFHRVTAEQPRIGLFPCR